jgi:hypothetical protein
MVHRKYPVLGGLALGLFLLASQLAATAAMNGAAAEYSDAVGRGLASRDASESSVREREKPLRSAQTDSALPEDDVSPEALQMLKKELDLIRRGTGEGNSAVFDPPMPVRKKTASPQRDLAEAGTFPQSQQPIAKLDPEIGRALGRVLLMSFKGAQPSDGGPKSIHALLQSGLVVGAVFKSENVQSKVQLKELMKFLWQGGGPTRPLFAIAEIGGTSDSLPAIKDFEQWPSEQDVAAKGDPEYAYSTYRSMGSNLAALGFNMNFGPTLGASGMARSPSASFGSNPLQAGVFAKTFLLGHREASVIPVPVVDSSELSVRALKTLLVSYPDTPIAANMTNEIQPFAPYEDLVRGPRFCFVTLANGSDGSATAGNFNRGCDVLVLDGGAESPSTVRERVAQSVADAIQHGELTLDVLNASSQRLFALRSSLASLSYEGSKRTARSP